MVAELEMLPDAPEEAADQAPEGEPRGEEPEVGPEEPQN